MERNSRQSLLEKWDLFINRKMYNDIKSDYDALQIAQLLENTYKNNKVELAEIKNRSALLEAGENYVPINGMQPSLLLPLMRRVYPKIIMQNFVSVQTLPSPNAVVHYLRRIFLTQKNGVNIGEEFTGLPSQFDKWGNFNPFFSSELVKSAQVSNNANKEITIVPSSIKFYNEKGELLTINYTASDNNDVRRIVIPVNFETSAGSKYNGWLIRGRNTAGYTGGILWKFTFFPTRKYVVNNETSIFPIPTDNQFSFNLSGTDIVISYTGTDYVKMNIGWVDQNGVDINETKYAYFSLDLRKYPKVMPEMGIQIDTMPITTKDRKFKIRYNPKEEKIFQDYLNLSLATELVNEISDQMAYEIDREIKEYLEMIIIEDLREFVDVSQYKVQQTHGTFQDPMLYLMFRLELFGAKMEAINKMGRPNVVLVSPKISAMLNHLPTFKFYDDNVSHPAGGIYKIGSIPGKYDFYVDAQAKDDTILLAHKHESSPFGAGVIYAPYFSFLTPEIYDGDTGDKTRILILTYGLEKVPYGEYLYGAIHISGINNI